MFYRSAILYLSPAGSPTFSLTRNIHVFKAATFPPECHFPKSEARFLRHLALPIRRQQEKKMLFVQYRTLELFGSETHLPPSSPRDRLMRWRSRTGMGISAHFPLFSMTWDAFFYTSVTVVGLHHAVGFAGSRSHHNVDS